MKIKKLISFITDNFPKYSKIIQIYKLDLFLLDETSIKDIIIDHITKYDISLPLKIKEIEDCVKNYYPEYMQDVLSLSENKKKEALLLLQDIVNSL